MSKSQKLIEKIKKNPMISLIIMELIALLLPGYSVTTIPEEQHYPKILIKAAFENMNNFTFLFQIFIVISPFAMLLLYFVKIDSVERYKIKIYKVLLALGSVGSIMYIWMVKRFISKAKDLANLGDFELASQELKLGIAPWIILILFVIQFLYIWVMYSPEEQQDATQQGDDSNLIQIKK